MNEVFSYDAMVSAVEKASIRPIPTDQVLKFAQSADPDSLEDVAAWSKAGSSIPGTSTPFEAFSTQLEAVFPRLTRQNQEELLRSSSRMVFGDFPRRGTTELSTWGAYSRLESFILFEGGVLNKSGVTYTRNIAIYIEKVLEMTGGDLEAAKTFLLSVSAIRHRTKISLGNSLSFLYRSRELDAASRQEDNRLIDQAKQIRKKFQGSHPKARALAFWADARFGTFDLNGKNADIKLREVLAENDPALKTEVLRYVKDKLLADPPGYSTEYALIEKTLRSYEDLYALLRQEKPDALFVHEYETIQRLIKLRKLEGKIQGGFIEPKDLIILLTAYPNLIEHVSEEELEKAISVTKDHGLIATLENLLARRKLLGRITDNP